MVWKQYKEDEQKFLKVLIAGEPGVGKTIIGLLFPDVGLLPLEAGHLHYRPKFDFVELIPNTVTGKWTFADLMAQLQLLEDPAKHPVIPSTGRKIQTLVIDTITLIRAGVTGILVDEVRKKISTSNRKNKDDLSRKDWGDMGYDYELLMRILERIPLNVVALCRMKTDMDGDMKFLVPYVGTGTDYVFDLYLSMTHMEGKNRKLKILKDRTSHYPRHAEIDNPTWDNFFYPILKDLRDGKSVLKIEGGGKPVDPLPVKDKKPITAKDVVQKAVKDAKKNQPPIAMPEEKKPSPKKKGKKDTKKDKKEGAALDDYWSVKIDYGGKKKTDFFLPKEYDWKKKRMFMVKVLNQKLTEDKDPGLNALRSQLEKMLKGKEILDIPEVKIDIIWEMLMENNPKVTIEQAE